MADDIITEILSRSIDNIVDRESLEKRLRSGDKLRIKFGIDPTSPNIHLGRAVPLLKLRLFQALGHQIVFLVGDFTAMIGDTSDKEAERPMIAREQVLDNLKSYTDQAGKILDMNKVEVVYNSHWLNGLTFKEISEQADVFSVNDFISRSNIKDRLDKGGRVSLREMLYPMMQGYDSVQIKSDIEIGGADQWFNMLAGRKLQKHFNQEPQDILALTLVEGTDGRKMSSSWGNTINLIDEPKEMFGKVMSADDDLIGKYFEHFTDLPMSEVENIKSGLDSGDLKPRDAKENLAFEITKIYWGEDGAEEGRDHFNKVFRDKALPDEIEEVKVTSANIVDILVEVGFVDSKSDARRAIEQKGVRVNDEVVTDDKLEVLPNSIIQKGKRNVVKISLA
jgi:tyrosyl-tRNA synthetase